MYCGSIHFAAKRDGKAVGQPDMPLGIIDRVAGSDLDLLKGRG